MKLMTKELEQKLQKYPLYSQDGKGFDAEVVVKFFNPIGAGTWLITEGQKEDNGDWLLFGYCLIFEWEWGYVRLSELESINLPFGFSIEQDCAASDKTVKELYKQEEKS